MIPEKISFALDQLSQCEPVTDVNLDRKSVEQMKANYVVCAGGKIYCLTDEEFNGLLGWLNDYPGRIQIASESVIYTSPKGESGRASVRPY